MSKWDPLLGSLDIATLSSLYGKKQLSPAVVISGIYRHIAQRGDDASRAERAQTFGSLCPSQPANDRERKVQGNAEVKGMRTTIMQSLLALSIVGRLALTSPAQAGDGGRVAAGVAVGTLLGLGIAGAFDRPPYYAYDHYGPGCYVGPRRCTRVGGGCWYNRFGEYICGGGEWRCWRRRICD